MQNLSCAQMFETLTLFIGVLKYSLLIENLGYSMVIGSEDDCHGKVSLLQFPRGGDTAHRGWGCKEKHQTWPEAEGDVELWAGAFLWFCGKEGVKQGQQVWRG